MIGFDIQKVENVKQNLLEKIALENEIAYIKRFKKDEKQQIASLWAVKEAVFKALDISGGDISFKEIELCHKESGAPFVKLSGNALNRFNQLSAKKIEVSISNQKDIVGAVAIVL